MAILKLMNIKECKDGRKSRHLKNAIKYILNPEKVKSKTYEGFDLNWSNCGTVDWQEVYDCFMQTKEDYEKLSGRQGYHFVISFKPGECSDFKAWQIGCDFCREYVDDYDYCMAVHNDQHHMHIHIVFNSVNRYSGYKWRYIKGDWEKKLQPIVDRITEKHGLSKLEYDRENRIGKSYGEHYARRTGNPTKTDIICMDIDYAIARASSLKEFYSILESQGYEIREGKSEVYDRTYVTFHPPFWERGKRDYKLGKGYSLPEIEERIKGNSKYDALDKWASSIGEIPERFTRLKIKQTSVIQIKMIRKITYACRYNAFVVPYKDNAKVRKDLLKIRNICEDCDYIIRTGLTGKENILSRLEEVEEQLKYLKKQKYVAGSINDALSPKDMEIRNRYFELQNRLADDSISDEEFEKVMDEIEMIEESVDSSVLADLPENPNENAIELLYNERRILNRILKNYDDTMEIPEYPKRKDIPSRFINLPEPSEEALQQLHEQKAKSEELNQQTEPVQTIE